MKKLIILPYVFFLAALILLLGCESENEIKPHVDPEEPISKIEYTLTPVTGGEPIVLSWVDQDGDFGNDPIINSGILSPNQNYAGSIELFLGAGENPDNFTAEVLEEKEEYQVFYSSNINDLQITYSDQDINGNPIGLQSSLTTEKTGTGSLEITLLYELDKFAEGVANGEIERAGGITDIKVSIPITVE